MILPDSPGSQGTRAKSTETPGSQPATAMAAETPDCQVSKDGTEDRIGETQGTIGADGKRVWIYPREIKGKFTRNRSVTAWFLMSVYLGVPWLRWRGEPLFLLDWTGGKLMLLSRYFRPPDIPLFLPAFFSFVLVIILATARFGRIWCGWACPQTVFLQFLFAPIERLVEGKATRRKKRDQGPITPEWLMRKSVKHFLFGVVSLIIGNTALAYLWGTRNLLSAIGHPSQNLMGLALVIGFTAVFYWIFAFFREQACIMLCPYARFQSVLLDEQTSLIAYDGKRGERRGKGPRGSREGLGDCTDCLQCVQVCPTGIDIRMGQQLECIGCARCIDACDRTMAAWKKPAGLIRYASLGELQGKAEKGKRWRLIAYAVLALIMGSLSGTLLLRRPAVTLNVVRRGQTPYVRVNADSVLNTFTLHLQNNGPKPRQIRVQWAGAPRGQWNWQGRAITLAGGQSLELPMDITVPVNLFQRGKLETDLLVADAAMQETLSVEFAGPWGLK